MISLSYNVNDMFIPNQNLLTSQLSQKFKSISILRPKYLESSLDFSLCNFNTCSS